MFLVCKGLGLSYFRYRHLGFNWEKCRPLDLAWYNVIHKKATVNHDCHLWFQQWHNPRLTQDLFVADWASIEWRGDRTVWSNSHQTFEGTVLLLCREYFTLQKCWEWALAPQLCAVKDDYRFCMLLEFWWQMFSDFLLKQYRGSCSMWLLSGWLWTDGFHTCPQDPSALTPVQGSLRTGTSLLWAAGNLSVEESNGKLLNPLTEIS